MCVYFNVGKRWTFYSCRYKIRRFSVINLWNILVANYKHVNGWNPEAFGAK